MLVEWRVTPDYVVNNWTDEMLHLLLHKMVERKDREIDAIRCVQDGKQEDNVVPDRAMFKMIPNWIEVKNAN